ncbi:ABC transporter permease subunit [Pantoea sp. Ap-967]|uniref:ABC transporter permease subunit n=1 Tax=Pantoea sp. Ap-967 TaxID=2608362 RepID=UPI001423A411|nr:ABC transporter permease subunit [Pantoea sp. Ap-967]NIE72952.1 ABC transporter permease subunit [Pantoea sp. Ap-967]
MTPNSRSGKLVVAAPYAFFLFFLFVPFLLVCTISFTASEFAVPPYSPIVSWSDRELTLSINLANYLTIALDGLYLNTFLSSLKFSAINTLLCLLAGYPMAYCIARADHTIRSYLLIMVMLPMWLSFLVRVYAWMAMLKNDGFINQFLLWLGVIDSPIQMYRTNFSVYLVMVITYLPLMIVPLYNCISKIDHSLIEAAQDLGAKPLTVLRRITLPLSKNGIIAGSLLVFIPSMGEYVIPQLMGGSDTLMLGRVIWQEFFSNLDWPMTSAITCMMVLMLLVPLAIFNKKSFKEGAL